ncbi:FAD synthase [Mesomycoplasma ovipneumoniae]|uniref:FAD synthase n=1 Tax=Mesomycoplasma ovipneumoniae TaxID=29562 RepID=UPI00083E7225|nr:riboflavin biosynthesis protein [Mesomycoplasma ovipneumoniae]
MTKVFYYPSSKFDFADPVFVLGGFESFHLGHLELLKNATILGQNVILMLIRDPSKLPKNTGKNFTDLNARIQMMANSGVENILIFDFDSKMQELDGQEFIEIFLNYGAKFFVVGKNFSFGKNASWNSKKLQNFFPKTKIIDHLAENNKKISTKNLKFFLEFGDFENLNKFLASNFLVSTSISPEGKFVWDSSLICPASGIYLGYFVNINENIKFPVIIHIEFDSPTGKVHFFEHPNTHSGFLEIIKQIRLIYSQKNNVLKDQDIENAKHLFKEHHTKISQI